jgi:DNA-directed RNA polymerase specialized sigma24 family protein
VKGLDPAAEEAIREACARNDYGLATTRAFAAYGSEILSFLTGRLRSQSDGEEAFSMFAEDLCQALPAFEFRCSVRGYLYTLARNAGNRYASAPHNRRERNLSVNVDASLSAVVERARSETAAHKRTEVKDKIRAMRECLPEADQTLLILHVDRGLPWSEIALVMHESGPDLQGEPLARESARLRKRFERVKAELKQRAIDEGLLRG